MFRKIVSNLPYSPALIGELGFYAKRLRKEEVTRRAGLILTALALVVQSLIVFQPAEPANASDPSDMVLGGIGWGQNASINNFLRPYDNNTRNLKDIMTHVGITREEIAAAKPGTWMTGEKYSWGLTPRWSYEQGERKISVPNKDGKIVRDVYARPMKLTNGQMRVHGFIGHSKAVGWFAIMNSCGNLVTDYIPSPPKPQPPEPPKPPTPQPAAECEWLRLGTITRTSRKLHSLASVKNGASVRSHTFTIKDERGRTVFTERITTNELSRQVTTELSPGTYTAEVVIGTSVGDRTSTNCKRTLTVSEPDKCPLNADLSIEDPECQPCPGDNDLWIKDDACVGQILRTKSAHNIDLDTDATEQPVSASQRVHFTLTAENVGKAAGEVELVDEVHDILEYASIIDNGGGTFDEEAGTLSWGSTTLEPGETTTRTFAVAVHDTIPAMAQGVSESASYDCVIVNTFGTTTEIPVDCPLPKVVEQVVTELPQTGPGANMAFAAVILSVVTFFYARSRQLKKEVRLIRRDFNAGTI